MYTTLAEMETVEQLWMDAESKYQYENNMTLATGYGVCQNDAELFQALCARLGITSCMITGSASADMFRKCLVAQMMHKKTSFSLRPVKSGAYGGIACIRRYDLKFGSCPARTTAKPAPMILR